MKKILILAALVAAVLTVKSHANVLISGYMANPAGTDGNNEYVQLVAANDIDFSVTNYSVVFANNGTATANGWAAGAALTYKFNLTSGTVVRGETFYVGGTGQLVNGAGSASMASLKWIRTIASATTNGDGFGNFNNSGVLGNGGANADGIAVFSGTAVTSSSTPIDQVFFGTGVGNAVVSGGTAGYRLAANDRYSPTFLQSDSFLYADPTSGNFTKLTGTFNYLTNQWTTARTAGLGSPSTLSDLTSGISVVPEPSALLLVGSVLGVSFFRRRRA